MDHVPPDSTVPPPSETKPVPIAFRDVQWTWKDIVIGSAPAVLFWVANSLITPKAGQDARWSYYLIYLQVVAWMFFYPIWTARRRGAKLPRPSVRGVMIEAAIAIPVFIILAIAIVIILAV